VEIYRIYKQGFRFEDRAELNRFVEYCVKTAERYISFLIRKGKIFLPFDIKPFDAAIDLTAELFKRERNALVLFAKYFNSLDQPPENEEDCLTHLKSFLFSILQQNLIELFKSNDPLTYKIMRNIRDAASPKSPSKGGGIKITPLFSTALVHRKEIEFDNRLYPDRDELLNLIYASGKPNFDNMPEFLKSLFDVLEANEQYLPAANFNDLVFVYKTLVINKYSEQLQQQSKSADGYAGVGYKFLFEDFKQKFHLKLKKYAVKTNISDDKAQRMYFIADDVLNSFLNGCRRKSISELTKEYFPGDENKYFNKVEYCVQILTQELIQLLREENAEG